MFCKSSFLMVMWTGAMSCLALFSSITLFQEPEDSGFPLEQWTNPDHSSSFEARFFALEGNEVQLVAKDGTKKNFSIRYLSPESAARARELAGILGENSSLSDVRRDERNLLFADKIAMRYRRILADENADAKTVLEATARLELVKQAQQTGKILVDGEFITTSDLENMEKKSLEGLRKGISAIEARDYPTAIRNFENASRCNPVAPHAEMAMGLIASMYTRNHAAAERNYREAAKRSRQYRDILDLSAPMLELAALNNAALACIKQNKLDEAQKIWTELMQAKTIVPDRMKHNIRHMLTYAEIGSRNAVFNFFKRDAEKLLAAKSAFETWGELASVGDEKGIKYMWVVPPVESFSDDLSLFNQEALNDLACFGCDGRGRLVCSGCAGIGQDTVQVPTTVNGPLGTKHRVFKSVVVTCKTCKKKGHVDCPYCLEGKEILPGEVLPKK